MLCFVLGFLLAAGTANCCGIGTHIEAGERARHFTDIISGSYNIKALIEKHQDAFQAGAPYPDAYYPDVCFDGNYNDVSEDTHWTPFLKASIEYVRNNYPEPWDEATEKLIVFILGVVSHQVADVSWHALGIAQGFLQTMGKVNYHGSFNEAHSDGDFGGDVLNWYQLNMEYVGTTDKWYVPTQDLLNIYRDMYNTPDRMPLEVIENCTNLLYLGRLGESIGVIDLLYPDYAEASPFLLDRLHDFFLGGMDDMAVWSDNIWKHAMTMIEQGTEICDLPRNPLYITCNTDVNTNSISGQTVSRNENRDSIDIVNPGMDSDAFFDTISLVNPGDIITERTERGIYFSYNQPEHSPTKWLQENVGVETSSRQSIDLPTTIYSTNMSYSRLGEIVLTGDVNNDGYDDLAISAPSYGVDGNYQKGRVYIVYGSEYGLPKANLTVENDADLILEGRQLNGKFGTSLAILDINKDGLNDLVVGAPSVGSESLQYQGEVYIYFGASKSSLPKEPSFKITCAQKYCNLGWTLTTGDLNQDGHPDLVVGAPYAPAGGEQRGFVGVIYSKTGIQDTDDSSFDWKWNGKQNYEWLGYSLSVSDSPDDGSRILTVGAPTYRLCARPDCRFDRGDVESVGKIYAFGTPLPDTPSHTIDGSNRFSQMGYSLTGGSMKDGNVLAVTSVSGTADVNTQAGFVSIYNSLNSIQPSTVQIGDREFGRFGSKTLIADVIGNENNDLIIAAPFRSETVEERREEGLVYIYNGDDISSICPIEAAAKTLGLGEDKARFGSSLTTLKYNKKVDIIVSAPHSNTKARLAGRVAVFKSL